MAAKLPSLAQLRTSLIQVQNKISEVLTSMTDAVTEVEEAKADKTELDDFAKQLANGNLTFGLYTSDGSVLCTSDGAELTANRPI